MKLIRLFAILALTIVFTELHAQGLAFEGIATNDASKEKYEKARVEIDFDDVSESLRLMILPSVEAMRNEALIDTVWKARTYYREALPESTTFFEERNIFFLYQLEDDKYLESYTVFSQFVDKKNKSIKQIVIRKFDENGKRLWCVSINADSSETDAFFHLLKNAKKKLRFRQLNKVLERPDPNVKHRPVFEDNKIREKNDMHGGNPYNSRY